MNFFFSVVGLDFNFPFTYLSIKTLDFFYKKNDLIVTREI